MGEENNLSNKEVLPAVLDSAPQKNALNDFALELAFRPPPSDNRPSGRDIVSSNAETTAKLARFESDVVKEIQSSRLDSSGQPLDSKLSERLKEFGERLDIKAQDKIAILDTLTRISKGEGLTPSGITDISVRRALVAGLIDNLARPTHIDQGATNTCTTTALQEQLFRHEPLKVLKMAEQMYNTGKYTAPIVDGEGRVTKQMFSAEIPPDFMSDYLRGTQFKDQTKDGSLNAATIFQSVGMINHSWQQKGKYYTIDTICMVGSTGERVSEFDATLQAKDRFTNRTFMSGNPAIFGVIPTADMGVAAGLSGPFLIAHTSHLDARKHAGIIGVNSVEELNDSMRKLGRNSVITIIDSKKVLSNAAANSTHIISLEKFSMPGNEQRFRVSDQNGWRSRIEGVVAKPEFVLDLMKRTPK